MSIQRSWNGVAPAWLAIVMLTFACGARADVVADANARAAEIASTVRATPIAVRAMAIVQVSVFDAVQSITGRHRPVIVTSAAPRGASVEAVVVAAARTALLVLVPAQKQAIEADYQAALAACTPMLTRLTPWRASTSTLAGTSEFGLHSTVNSAPCASSSRARTRPSSASISAAGSADGVPPPT